MDQDTKTQALVIWLRLVGCFGDALGRRFGPEPPPEWVAQLGTLNQHQIDRAFRRMMSAGLSSPPTLPAFMRYARAIGDDNDPPPLLPSPRVFEPPEDRWKLMANQWLMVHIRNQIAEKPRRWGAPESIEMHLNVGRLVEAKNHWAADMKDLAQNDAQGRVPMGTAKAIWKDYIQRSQVP